MNVFVVGLTSLVAGAALGGAYAAVVVSGSAKTEKVAFQREAFARGCSRGFEYGYAAREIWDAEATSVRETLKPGDRTVAERAIQIAKNESVKDMEAFRRRSAYVVASVAAASEPGKRMCESSVPYF